MGKPLTEWLNACLSFLFPENCQTCGRQKATPEESYVCQECAATVRRIKPPFCQRCGLPFEGALTTSFECGNCKDIEPQFTSARAAVAAKEVMLDVIHRYKYQRALWFEPFLARLLVEAALPSLASGNWQLIVPVPLHPLKEREREFNQARRLAVHLGRASGIPMNDRLVRRVIATRTQTQLSRSERLANVRRAFVPRRGAVLRGEGVILVDDVFTTGATTSACAGALLRAGASNVCVWTVARGI